MAEAAFRARVEELGGAVLEPRWLGSLKLHRIQCAAGHEVKQRPNSVLRGQGLCRACAGNDPKISEAQFRARVAELGGTVLETAWLGVKTPHRVRCAAGHESTPRPTAVQQGGGICRLCMGKTWDAFYVVLDDENQTVKFGITSGDSRPRLATHARDGYHITVRLMRNLPPGAARQVEKATLAALALANVEPVRGHEYFHAAVLPIVLDIADNYPLPPQTVRTDETPEVEQAA
ncbi:hypothetical protein [Streptomyces sp. NPDC059788]|uniref:hypothetical protein n=1 Tax=Streptomyces sp. NPDC059788 TaxID=3346948 RepID=UPI003659F244